MTGQFFGECKGHSSTINHISFSGASTPHALHSCSSDGTIRAWDTRTFHEVSCITAGSSQEIFSFSFGGSDDNLLAAGCLSQAYLSFYCVFYHTGVTKYFSGIGGIRSKLHAWRNSNMEDVTQCFSNKLVDIGILLVESCSLLSLLVFILIVDRFIFIPGYQNKLASASADGLICIFDTSGDINDDDHLKSVSAHRHMVFILFSSMTGLHTTEFSSLVLLNCEDIFFSGPCSNHEKHVAVKLDGNQCGNTRKVGFFWDSSEKLWCLTNIETLGYLYP
ncbi:hypothetical protein CRYUN_Cryun14cG0087700 [Craigia yunnanensis]